MRTLIITFFLYLLYSQSLVAVVKRTTSVSSRAPAVRTRHDPVSKPKVGPKSQTRALKDMRGSLEVGLAKLYSKGVQPEEKMAKVKAEWNSIFTTRLRQSKLAPKGIRGLHRPRGINKLERLYLGRLISELSSDLKSALKKYASRRDKAPDVSLEALEAMASKYIQSLKSQYLGSSFRMWEAKLLKAQVGASKDQKDKAFKAKVGKAKGWSFRERVKACKNTMELSKLINDELKLPFKMKPPMMEWAAKDVIASYPKVSDKYISASEELTGLMLAYYGVTKEPIVGAKKRRIIKVGELGGEAAGVRLKEVRKVMKKGNIGIPVKASLSGFQSGDEKIRFFPQRDPVALEGTKALVSVFRSNESEPKDYYIWDISSTKWGPRAIPLSEFEKHIKPIRLTKLLGKGQRPPRGRLPKDSPLKPRLLAPLSKANYCAASDHPLRPDIKRRLRRTFRDRVKTIPNECLIAALDRLGQNAEICATAIPLMVHFYPIFQEQLCGPSKKPHLKTFIGKYLLSLVKATPNSIKLVRPLVRLIRKTKSSTLIRVLRKIMYARPRMIQFGRQFMDLLFLHLATIKPYNAVLANYLAVSGHFASSTLTPFQIQIILSLTLPSTRTSILRKLATDTDELYPRLLTKVITSSDASLALFLATNYTGEVNRGVSLPSEASIFEAKPQPGLISSALDLVANADVSKLPGGLQGEVWEKLKPIACQKPDIAKILLKGHQQLETLLPPQRAKFQELPLFLCNDLSSITECLEKAKRWVGIELVPPELEKLREFASLPLTCNSIPKQPQDRRKDKDHLSIASFNAEWAFMSGGSGKVKCPSTECPWHTESTAIAHLEDIAKAIVKMDATIVHINEVQGCNVLKFILSMMPPDHGYKPYLIKGMDSMLGQQVGILTRIDPVEKLQLIRTRVNYPVPGSKCQSQSQGTAGLSKNYVAKFKIKNKKGTIIPLVLLGFHMMSMRGGGDSCLMREAGAAAARDYLRAMRKGGPYKDSDIVATGDANDEHSKVPSASPRCQAESEAVEILASAQPGMKNAALLLPQAQRYTYIHQGQKATLDHLLHYQKRMKLKSFTIEHGLMTQYSRSRGVHRLSDHRPILAVFDLS